MGFEIVGGTYPFAVLGPAKTVTGYPPLLKSAGVKPVTSRTNANPNPASAIRSIKEREGRAVLRFSSNLFI